jgi:hypothetical protein
VRYVSSSVTFPLTTVKMKYLLRAKNRAVSDVKAVSDFRFPRFCTGAGGPLRSPSDASLMYSSIMFDVSVLLVPEHGLKKCGDTPIP